ncbi:MAG: sugar ABC transporter substrate-binding protein [Rhodospirillales bacterium]|nr:MAG: sugar ABC transporter substrate-binding protein [Rhodospirillales bacterium]
MGKIAASAMVVLMVAAGCSRVATLPEVRVGEVHDAPAYRIGPLDNITIFVWRNPELSTSVPVRPDGRISVPLLEDVQAADKTPTELARELESELDVFIQNPLVTVIVTGFSGTFEQQIRVVGQAQQPRSIPFRANMTMLDVMIAVGGLTPFANGNRATLVRVVDGQQKEFRVRLGRLIQDGHIDANVAMLPGDIVIIPETFF